MKPIFRDSKGVALVVVIIIFTMLALMASFAMNLGYNQRRLSHVGTGTKVVNYYRAQAGVVDAYWRIRTNQGGIYTPPAFDPPAYFLDVDNNAVNDTTVDIGPVNAQGRRPILSTGLDV